MSGRTRGHYRLTNLASLPLGSIETQYCVQYTRDMNMAYVTNPDTLYNQSLPWEWHTEVNLHPSAALTILN